MSSGPRSPEGLKLAVLASGTGTNLQALIDTVHGHDGVEIVAVASDKPAAQALSRASAAGVSVGVFERVNYENRGARDRAMGQWIASRGARLIVLAGYMQLLGPSFLEQFPGAVINVHPALLPAFQGLNAVGQALDYGVKVFGVTVHFVDEGVDTGAVILQQAVQLPQARDHDDVMAALRPIEHALLCEAVRLFARGALRADPANPRRVLVER